MTRRIAVTGGAGQIAYNLLFRIASGEMLGFDQPVALHILEIPQAIGALEGVTMELEDCAFPLLEGVVTGSDPNVVFKDVDLALLVGAKPRGPGMERKDLLAENAKIFVEQGKALNRVASRDVRTLVVGNPCNTNALICAKNAPDLPPEHFFAMTRLDQNRAMAQLAMKAGVPVRNVDPVTIWGNHSSTQVPDFVNAKIGGKPATDLLERSWLEGEFWTTVQKRGGAIIAARGKSSAASAANAALDAVQSLYQPTEHCSMGVYSAGNPYGIDDDLIFSFPCRSDGEGELSIIADVPWDDFLKQKMQATEKELQEEREATLG